MNINGNLDYRNRNIARAATIAMLLLFTTFGAAFSARAGGVSLTATPTSNTVTVGQTTSYTIKINRDGYTDKVTLSATGLPAGVTATFTPNTTTANSSTLKLQTATTTPIGTFNLTIKGTATGVTIAPITVKLITKAQSAVSISVLPAVQSIIAGQETSFEVAINRTNFDGPVTLSVANLPSGVSVQFDPGTTYGSTARMFLYSGGLPPSLGEREYSINVNALASGLLINGLKLTLYVNCGMIWVKQFAVPDPQTGVTETCFHSDTGMITACPEFAAALTEDASGNVYVAGNKIVPDAGGNLVWPFNYDAFVAKYDSAGNQRGIWVFQNPTMQEFATDVAVDNAGNIFVAGYKQTNDDRRTAEIFIAKVNANGTIRMTNGSFGFGVGEDGTGGMTLMPDGNGGAVITAPVNIRRVTRSFDRNYIEAAYDIQQIYFDANLNLGSSTPVAFGVDGDPVDLALGNDGSIAVVGVYTVFPFNPLDRPVVYRFTNKYTLTNGVWRQAWRNDVNSSLSEQVSKVALAPNGDLFVGGSFPNLIGGTPPTSVIAYWLEKTRADGCLTPVCGAWRREGTVDSKIGALEIDSNGDVYYGGTTEGSLAITRPTQNIKDAWFAKSLGSTGELIYIRQFDAANVDELKAIKIGLNGDLLFAGYTAFFTGVQYGYEDALLMKYRLEENVLNPPPNPHFLKTRVTGINPTTVRSGANFSLQGIFTDVKAVFLNGSPVSFTSSSLFSQLQAQAPTVSSNTNFNVVVSTGCKQISAPGQLTVTP